MNIVVYSRDNCPWCDKAKALLGEKNLSYTEKKYNRDFTKIELMEIINNPLKEVTVPQIVIDGVNVGGYTDLVKHFN